MTVISLSTVLKASLITANKQSPPPSLSIIWYSLLLKNSCTHGCPISFLYSRSSFSIIFCVCSGKSKSTNSLSTTFSSASFSSASFSSASLSTASPASTASLSPLPSSAPFTPSSPSFDTLSFRFSLVSSKSILSFTNLYKRGSSTCVKSMSPSSSTTLGNCSAKISYTPICVETLSFLTK